MVSKILTDFKNICEMFNGFLVILGEKATGGGRESGSDAWKQYMRRSTCKNLLTSHIIFDILFYQIFVL